MCLSPRTAITGSSLVLNMGAFGTIEQPLQMKSGQRVVGVQADQGREGWHRRGVARLELGERVAILRVDGRLERGVLQWFECAKWLATAAQQDISNWPSLKIAGSVGRRGADANAGAEMLVGGLKPRSRVDGVAVSGVVEETAAAKIADQRRFGVNADPRSAEWTPFSFHRSRNARPQMSRSWAHFMARLA